MDTVTIEYFLEIAEGTTYGETAEKFHISQSSVSKAISRLENEMGVQLFCKNQYRATLTEAGRVFYQGVKALYPAFDQAVRTFAHYDRRREITICAVPSWDSFNIRYTFLNADLNTQLPDARIELVEDRDMADCTEAITGGELDFGVMHLFSSVLRRCDFQVLKQDAVYAVLPKGHPLEGRAFLTAEDLRQYQALLGNDTTRLLLEEMCCELDFPLPSVRPANQVQLRQDQQVCCIMMDRENRYTLLFESDVVSLNLSRVCCIPVQTPSAYPIVLCWKKRRDLAEELAAFRDFFIRLIRAESAASAAPVFP